MDERHRLMWQVVNCPEDVVAAFEVAAAWTEDARGFATP